MLTPIVEKTLDELLSGKELGPEYYLEDKESSWMEKVNGEFKYGFIRDRLPYYKDPLKRQQIIDRFKEVELRDGKLVLYRGLMHDKDITLDNMGICWSFSEKKAYCYGGTGLKYWYRYFALVDIDAVNWHHTIQKGMVHHSHEKEVRLIPDSPILIYKVEKRKITVCDLLETHDINFITKV